MANVSVKNTHKKNPTKQLYSPPPTHTHQFGNVKTVYFCISETKHFDFKFRTDVSFRYFPKFYFIFLLLKFIIIVIFFKPPKHFTLNKMFHLTQNKNNFFILPRNVKVYVSFFGSATKLKISSSPSSTHYSVSLRITLS